MFARAPWLFALLLPLAGCLDAATPRLDAGDLLGGAAPPWRVGDWWTYRFTSDIYRLDTTMTLVVGQAGPGGYVVGMPVDGYELEPILFHVPPVGRLTPTLGYNVHDVAFDPFRFPLVDGASWETKWVASPVTYTARAAKVTTPEGLVDGFRISNEGNESASNRFYIHEFAPAVGWYTKYERIDLDGRVRERFELVAHGHGYGGPVRLLDGITMLFLEGRTLAPGAGLPPPPMASFAVKPGVDTVYVACGVGDAAGHYRAEVRAPGGNGCLKEATVPPTDTLRGFDQREVPAEAGPWQVQLVAGGPGLAVAEVMGYRAWNVDLG